MNDHRDISDMLDALADLDGASMPPDLPGRIVQRLVSSSGAEPIERDIHDDDSAPLVMTRSSAARWAWPLTAAAGLVLLATLSTVMSNSTPPREQGETIAIADEVEGALVLCAMFDGSMDEEIDLLFADTATLAGDQLSFADSLDSQIIDLEGNL